MYKISVMTMISTKCTSSVRKRDIDWGRTVETTNGRRWKLVLKNIGLGVKQA